MPIPHSFRRFLGRSRLAINFVLGRQVMTKGVQSYDDDVWLVSYPRSGNTWTRFLLGNLLSNREAVDWSNIEWCVPDIYVVNDSDIRHLPRPRYFKSHEAYRPEYRRVVMIVRDPRDVALSYLHYMQKSHRLSLDASIEDFIVQFLAGRCDPYGSWGENVGSWLGARCETADFLLIRYEDLLRDTAGELGRIARFLGLDADESRLRRAVENSSADRMRSLEQLQHDRHKSLKRSRKDIPFVRAATSGQWKTDLPLAAAREIEAAWGNRMRELGYLP